jgi:hypothetical protein
MSGTSNHHEIDWEFGFIAKTEAVELIQVIAKDVAIPVGIVAPGSVW